MYSILPRTYLKNPA